jgi:hypothetical protein
VLLTVWIALLKTTAQAATQDMTSLTAHVMQQPVTPLPVAMDSTEIPTLNVRSAQQGASTARMARLAWNASLLI